MIRYQEKIVETKVIITDFKSMLKDLDKRRQDRESLRLPFDHYTQKISGLNTHLKKHYNTDMYNRNTKKFNLHKNNFRDASHQLKLSAKLLNQQISDLIKELEQTCS